MRVEVLINGGFMAFQSTSKWRVKNGLYFWPASVIRASIWSENVMVIRVKVSFEKINKKLEGVRGALRLYL